MCFYFIILGALFLDNRLNIAFVVLGILSNIILFVLNPTTLPDEKYIVENCITICSNKLNIIWYFSIYLLLI